MKKKILSFILAIFISVSAGLTADAKYAGDTTKNWRYVVPQGKYDYCQILPNGFIKIGKRIGNTSLENGVPYVRPQDDTYLYGLLDKKGGPLTDIIYDSISLPNNDGYMLAQKSSGGKNTAYTLFDKSGKIVSTPKDANIVLFYNSYYIETAKDITFYIGGQSHMVLKNVLDKAGAVGEDENKNKKYYVYNNGIYNDCFVMIKGISYGRSVVVLDWNGAVKYKTDDCINVAPDGLILMNKAAQHSLVDFNGNVIIPAYWGRQIGSIADGLYSYSVGSDADGLYYRIWDIHNPDKIFRGKVPFSSMWYVDTENKLICLCKNDYNDCALYSFDGTEIMPFGYVAIGKPSDGLIRFQTKDNKFGVANLKGEVLFETDKYVITGDFSEGLLPYSEVEADGTWSSHYGFLDKNFKPVIQLPKDWRILGGFYYGLAPVIYNDEILFIDRSGKVMIAQGNEKWGTTYQGVNGLVGVHEGEIVVGMGWNSQYLGDGIIEYTGIPLGDVLYSDITAYINGSAIPTSVANGKTLVVAEDLAKYGFDVVWNNNDRTLKIELNKSKKFNPIPTEKDVTHKPGTFKCKYVYTDIKTYLSGKVIESYSINGRTLIDFELLGQYGKLAWDGKNREIRLVIN